MEKKRLDTFKKRLEDRQRELRETVNRTAQDGREAKNRRLPIRYQNAL